VSFPVYYVNQKIGINKTDPRKDLDITGDVAISGTLTVAGSAIAGLTIGTLGSTPTANGATASGFTLTLQPADATHAGVVSAGAQTIAGPLSVTNGVLPGTDEGAALGSATKRWVAAYIEALKDDSNNLRINTPGLSNNSYLDAVGSPGAASIAHDFKTLNTYSTAGGLLARWSTNNSPRSSISKDGAYGGTYTDTSGTPGDGVASTVTGRSAIAATSAVAITITNTLCKATSVVMATLEDNDATCKSLAVAPGVGSFTVTPGATTTAITKFRWILFNGA
jgi:hypothetical protein